LVREWWEVSAPIPPSGSAAICVLEATSNNAQPVSGYLHFVELMDTTLQITLVASGLSNGAHTFHVHTFGDISDPSGNSVQGHFVGNCSGCRPPGALQEAGLLNNGNPVTVAGGTVSYTFNEPIAKLSGTNSIVGRAIIIHGTAAGASVRAAQCVIGRWYEPLASPVVFMLSF
jgi:superoxide dismutase, Cu-Zn family